VGVVVCLLILSDIEPSSNPGAGRDASPPAPAPADIAAATSTEPSPARHRAAAPSSAAVAERTDAPTDEAPSRRVDEAPARPGEDATAPVAVEGVGGDLSVFKEVRATFVGVVLPVRESSPVNAPTSQSFARAKAAADRAAAAGTATDVDAMLRSSDDGDREAAIGAAMRSDPPMIAQLLRVARDAKAGGSIRSTALLAAIEAAPVVPCVAAAVVALTGDRDPGVRGTAIELLPRLGGAGADRAAAMLQAGDYDAARLDPLARTVAASDRALDFLLSGPPAETAFAVIRAIGATQPDDAAARARLLSRLPDAVRLLVRTPEMLVHGAEAFTALAAAGQVSYLRSVAVDTSLPTSLRLGAVDAAVAAPACADGLAALFAATLADGRSPVELLRAVVQRVPAGIVADGGVKAALRALAEDHSNEWLREEARAKLQASPPPGGGGALTIVSGVYGKDGQTVDVTRVLASMVVGARLVVEAGNALAGDPLVGTVKELAVTYAWKGEVRTRKIAEYETLTLP
jgi:hypothetical protein